MNVFNKKYVILAGDDFKVVSNRWQAFESAAEVAEWYRKNGREDTLDEIVLRAYKITPETVERVAEYIQEYQMVYTGEQTASFDAMEYIAPVVASRAKNGSKEMGVFYDALMKTTQPDEHWVCREEAERLYEGTPVNEFGECSEAYRQLGIQAMSFD